MHTFGKTSVDRVPPRNTPPRLGLVRRRDVERPLRFVDDSEGIEYSFIADARNERYSDDPTKWLFYRLPYLEPFTSRTTLAEFTVGYRVHLPPQVPERILAQGGLGSLTKQNFVVPAVTDISWRSRVLSHGLECQVIAKVESLSHGQEFELILAPLSMTAPEERKKLAREFAKMNSRAIVPHFSIRDLVVITDERAIDDAFDLLSRPADLVITFAELSNYVPMKELNDAVKREPWSRPNACTRTLASSPSGRFEGLRVGDEVVMTNSQLRRLLSGFEEALAEIAVDWLLKTSDPTWAPRPVTGGIEQQAFEKLPYGSMMLFDTSACPDSGVDASLRFWGVECDARAVTADLNELFRPCASLRGHYRFRRSATAFCPTWHIWDGDTTSPYYTEFDTRWPMEQIRDMLQKRCGLAVRLFSEGSSRIEAVSLRVKIIRLSAIRSDSILKRVAPQRSSATQRPNWDEVVRFLAPKDHLLHIPSCDVKAFEHHPLPRGPSLPILSPTRPYIAPAAGGAPDVRTSPMIALSSRSSSADRSSEQEQEQEQEQPSLFGYFKLW